MTFNSQHDPTHLYFVTATLIAWKPLFAEPAYANIVLNSLGWSRRNSRLMLCAFVLMPSHLHAIIKPQECSIGDFLHEKLEYIHNNPIAKQWDLASLRADYHYSSACFYDRSETPVIPVDDIRPWRL